MTDEIKDKPKYKTPTPDQINPATGRRWKTGGRKKGTKNNPKIKIIREMKKQELANIKEILDENTSPLAFLLRTINDVNEEIKIRVDAAGKALPYIHGKRPNVTEITGRDGKPIEFSSAAARETLNGMLFEGTAQPVLEHKEGEYLEAEPMTAVEVENRSNMDVIRALSDASMPLEDEKTDD